MSQFAVSITLQTLEQAPDKQTGGGIGGLCMAIGLLHQNVSCTLYEATPAFAEIGAGVSFGPNAIRAMTLIDPDIKKGYDRIATSNAWPEKRNYDLILILGRKRMVGKI